MCNMHLKESVGMRENSLPTREQLVGLLDQSPCELAPEAMQRVEALVTELIGRVADKWTMLVIESLTEKGELRFTRLRESVPGISYKMLTQTLRSMEREGLVARTVHPGDSSQGGVPADDTRIGFERGFLRSLDMGGKTHRRCGAGSCCL